MDAQVAFAEPAPPSAAAANPDATAPSSTPPASLLFANVTLMGSAGSLHVCFCLRGFCLYCGRSTPEDRPIWLKRSVVSPLLGYADRPVRATHDGGRRVP